MASSSSKYPPPPSKFPPEVPSRFLDDEVEEETYDGYVCPVHEDQSCRREDGRNPHALYNDLPSLTQQHFTDECDINGIVERARQGQLVTHVNQREAVYADVSNIPSYRDAFEIVRDAEKKFMQLPWQAREKFGNDPQKMIEFLQNPENRDEAVKLGLVNAPVVDESLETLKSIDRRLGDDSRASGVQPDGTKAKPTGR